MLAPLKLRTLLGLLWLLGPALFMLRSFGAIARRSRLWSNPMTVTGLVTKVLPGGDATSLGEAMIVDLQLRYEIDGRSFSHSVTRTDHQQVGYFAGSEIDLVCEQDNPANVMDPSRRPWDDVIGPMVLSLLLAFFMAWTWQVFVGF